MIKLNEYQYLDKVLLIIWLGLISFGFLILNSVLAEHISSVALSPDSSAFNLSLLDKSKITYVLSLFVIAIVITIPTRLIVKLSKFALPICLIAASYVLLFGYKVNGSTTGVNINLFDLLSFRVSLSEILILFFILFLTHRYSNDTIWPKVNSSLNRATAIIGTCLLFFFVTLQPDMYTLFVLMMMSAVFLFLIGTRLIFVFSAIFCLLATIFLMLLASPYRMYRLASYLDPWADPYGSGYQLTQSLMAIGSGGWFGVGIDKSIIKLGYLPDVHSDFILALVAEELGLLGVIITLVGLSAFTLRLYITGNRNLEYGNRFAACFCWLVSFLLLTNIIFHSASVSGSIPIVGAYLPWISYGNLNFILLTVLVGVALRMDLERRLGILPKQVQ